MSSVQVVYFELSVIKASRLTCDCLKISVVFLSPSRHMPRSSALNRAAIAFFPHTFN
jgi:hypothetical protein